MNSIRIVRSILGILLVLLLLQTPTSPYSAVGAQADTVLSILPAYNDLTDPATVSVAIHITAAYNLQSFDIMIDYDPSVLTFVNYTTTSFLSPLYFIRDVRTPPGYLWLVATKLGSPPANGDGDLLILNFTAVNGIGSIIPTAAVFGTNTGYEYHPALESAVVYVHDNPADTPNFNVTGTITRQGQVNNNGGIPFSLGYGTVHWLGPYSTTSINQPASNLSFSQVEEDTYRITASSPRYLPVTEASNRTVSISASKTTIAPLLLRGGNAIWQDPTGAPDTVIDVLDLTLVSGQYLQTGANLEGDVNFSGRVDIFDFAMVAGNYGLTSITAYAGWIP